jgi:hypothetical protein
MMQQTACATCCRTMPHLQRWQLLATSCYKAPAALQLLQQLLHPAASAKQTA